MSGNCKSLEGFDEFARRRTRTTAQARGDEHHVGVSSVLEHGLANAFGVFANALTSVIQITTCTIVAIDTDVDALFGCEPRPIRAVTPRRSSR